MRAINTSQQNYSQQCNGYSPDLPTLKSAGNFLSPDLTGSATVAKSGFNVTVANGAGGTAIPSPPASCGAPTTNYYASAQPLSFGSTGTRSFATTEQGTIFYTSTAAAPDGSDHHRRHRDPRFSSPSSTVAPPCGGATFF